MYKNASRLFVFAVFATLLVASTLGSAQDEKAPFAAIKCTSGTACKKNFVPLYNSNGGGSTVKSSIMHQAGGAVVVAGAVSASTTGSAGVTGKTTASSGVVTGVFGNNTSGSTGSAEGTGVFGQISTTGESGTGQALTGLPVGTWGDGGLDGNYGVFGTADDRSAVIGENNGPDFYTLYSFNNATGTTGYPFGAFNGDGAGCYIDPSGSLNCSGSKNAVVPIDGGKHKVALSAIESPKNWFEDFGSEQLVGGVAVVRLDAKFTQTVNAKLEYHVFLTPNGDCKGLYVHQKSPTSFEVRELGGGNSNVKFDYRITALRKNFETIRFADHSHVLLPNKEGRAIAAKK